jgi:hypothetical protein
VSLGPAAAGSTGSDIAGGNTEIADFVSQGITVNSEGLCGTGEIAFIGAQRGDDELLLELSSGLIQGDSPSHQLIHNLPESPIQILLRHQHPLAVPEVDHVTTDARRPVATWRRISWRGDEKPERVAPAPGKCSLVGF